jgi:hypothetical protein
MNTEEKINKLEAEIAQLKSIQKFDFNTLPEAKQKQLIALSILQDKIKVANNGKTIDWNNNKQRKFEPIFNMRNGGFSSYITHTTDWFTAATVPSALVFLDEKDVAKFVNENIELYKDLYL